MRSLQVAPPIDADWIPPYNPVAERAVLGSVLLENDALDIAESLISVEAFDQVHGTIYSAMRKLRDDGEPIDLVTLTSRLQDANQLEKVGGVGYLSLLASEVPTAANVGFYAREVRRCWLQRVGFGLIRDLYQAALQHEDPARLSAAMEAAAAQYADQTAIGRDFRDMRDVMTETYDQLEARALSNTNGITGVPSGYAELDRLTSGFQRSDLIIVAARPSIGKTAFALNIAQHAGVRCGETVAIFSLEMSASQLGQRFLASEGHIDASKIRTGKLDFDDWSKIPVAINAISEARIYIDDTPGISVSDIRAKCRRLKKRIGRIGLVIIDYLQLVTVRGKRENRVQEVSEISRMLKQIAREIDAPVIALSQISRKVEDRQDKRPMLSDLRESGSIEQDADVVAFLYRDDYYDKESEKKNIIEVIVAKQRNGPVGTVELVFLKNYNRFVNLDRGHHEAAKVSAGRPIPDMHRGECLWTVKR